MSTCASSRESPETAGDLRPSPRSYSARRRSPGIADGRRGGRRQALHGATCGACGADFEAARVNAKWCSSRCRNRAARAKDQGSTPEYRRAWLAAHPDAPSRWNAAQRARRDANAARTLTASEHRCPRCGETKPVDAFRLDSRGYFRYCKACSLEINQEWRARNRERLRARGEPATRPSSKRA